MSYIKSIQKVSITIASGSTTNTATITAINTANTLLIFDGNQTSQATQVNYNSCVGYVTLTNSTTITAVRGASNTDTVLIRCIVIEFLSGVNSIQYGTVSIAAASTTGTATISAVGANAFIHYLGSSLTTAAANYADSQALLSFSGTTVTANNGHAFADIVISFVVCDLSIVDSVNSYTATDSSANQSWTQAITSVDTTRSIIIWAGQNNSSGASLANAACTLDLTSSILVTITRNGTNTSTRKNNFWIVEFSPKVLSSNGVQRGDITLPGGASQNVVLPNGLNNNFSFVNYCGMFGTGQARVNLATLAIATLGSITTVTAALNTAGASTVSYEAIDFNAFNAGHAIQNVLQPYGVAT